ncbi:hypothetical protein RB601_009678 [Gaeumannomyces tritici]
MGYPDTFEGFCVDSPKTWNKFYKHELKPKPFEENDIDVKIEACGVCGSGVHTLTGGRGDFEGPLYVGHEVVGRAVKVGKNVKNIREGDRVGPGKKVAVVGLGGLGHLGLQFAVAMGAEAYLITHSPRKAEDARTLGAKDVIAFTFNFFLNTADALDQFDLAQYFGTVRVGGQFHTVGISDKPFPELTAFAFASNAAKLTGSHLGNHQEMDDMLKLAAEKKLRLLRDQTKTIDVSEDGCREAVEKVKNNDVRYPFTLVNFDKAFGSR